MRTLDGHIARTERWRSGEKHSKLLLSFIRPHKPVVSFTLSTWLKASLVKSGVDTGTSIARSNRLHQPLNHVYKMLQKETF